MIDKERKVLEESRSVIGADIACVFDNEWFRIGDFVIVEEWDVEMPCEINGYAYRPRKLKRTYFGQIERYDGYDIMCLRCFPVNGGVGTIDLRIPISHYIHGYYRIYHAIIKKEGE